jgi:hypothetical protein
MDYAESSYFDGFAYQHIADFRELERLERINKRNRDSIARERRRNSRGRIN